MARSTIQESITDILRNSLVPVINWGTAASPYYQEAPEPPPTFPFVVFDIRESTVERQFEDAYVEQYQMVLSVLGTESQIQASLSPYHSSSIFYYLEGLLNTPEQFDSDWFRCLLFQRMSWLLTKEDLRAPSGERVWRAEANYTIEVTPK